VNAPDPAVRQNRLTLLHTMLAEFSTIADFSEIVTNFSGEQMSKNVYSFGGGTADGDGTMKDKLGGKGAGLAEMSRAGLPVPPGFTIATEVCNIYFKNGNRCPEEIQKEIDKASSSSKSRWGRSWATPRIRCCSACGRARSSPCPA
jgi:hypothetical protein